MTDPASKARQLAAHPEWKWQGGQLTLCGVRLLEGGKDYIIGNRPGATCDGGGDIDTINTSGFTPNLDDPATVGTIEGQTRAKCPNLIMFPPDSPGEVYVIGRGPIATDGSCLCYAPSLGEVWAQAFLEVVK